MRIKWDFDKIQKEALKYNTRSEFERGDHRAYDAGRSRGILDQVCSHMTIVLKSWDLELLKLEALKYNNRADFKKNSWVAYKMACKMKVLQTICEHMPEAFNKKLDLEQLRECAFKYRTISDFLNGDRSVYQIAWKRGVLDLICAHMERPKISSPEKTILEAVIGIYPTAKKFRATKLKIAGKEYIKTLEVDILVPELGKAIEYDGRWHHSLEGLKRGHPTWPEEDIKNYHEIKDAAFLALGIKILHINQNDWKRNALECIEKCLVFLESK